MRSTGLRERVVNLHTQYVNCCQDCTRFKMLYGLLVGLIRPFDVHRQPTPCDRNPADCSNA